MSGVAILGSSPSGSCALVGSWSPPPLSCPPFPGIFNKRFFSSISCIQKKEINQNVLSIQECARHLGLAPLMSYLCDLHEDPKRRKMCPLFHTEGYLNFVKGILETLWHEGISAGGTSCTLWGRIFIKENGWSGTCNKRTVLLNGNNISTQKNGSIFTCYGSAIPLWVIFPKELSPGPQETGRVCWWWGAESFRDSLIPNTWGWIKDPIDAHFWEQRARRTHSSPDGAYKYNGS